MQAAPAETSGSPSGGTGQMQTALLWRWCDPVPWPAIAASPFRAPVDHRFIRTSNLALWKPNTARACIHYHDFLQAIVLKHARMAALPRLYYYYVSL